VAEANEEGGQVARALFDPAEIEVCRFIAATRITLIIPQRIAVLARSLASDEAPGITGQAINVSAGSRTAQRAARRLEDPDDTVYDGQDREAIAPRYGRLRCCNDPVRRRAVSVAKLTGLTTAENSRSRGPGKGAAATAAA
jgi:hypothetical protein